MIQPHKAETPLEVTVSPTMFDFMQRGAQQAFEKEVGDLNFDEAARLVGGILVASAQGDGKGKATHEGQTIIDSIEDGKEAFEGRARQQAKELAPQIDDEREIILNVTRNQTLWEAIRNREPKVAQTYRFRNEPPQYA